MESNDELLRRAKEAEEMAAVVSYAPDKERLLRQADELRRKAAEQGAAPQA